MPWPFVAGLGTEKKNINTVSYTSILMCRKLVAQSKR
jgi:hypothetical protein